MEYDQRAQEALKERLAESEAERKQMLQHYAEGEWSQLAPVEQTVDKLKRSAPAEVAAEYERTAGDAAPRVRGSAPAGPVVVDDDRLGEIVFEQIIGKSEIMPVRFLTNGSVASRSIGRIVLPTRQPLGTGFLVSPRLLLTNCHVLETAAEAAHCIVQFDVSQRVDGTVSNPIEFRLAPDVLFVQSPIEKLDFSLVAVEPVNLAGIAVAGFGWCPLIGEAGKEHPGERVNIIHHPAGNPKQISLRENTVVHILDDHLHYMADTRPGSSGSPVFNDEWEVVALHHAGVEITDSDEIEMYRQAIGSDLPVGTSESDPTVSVNEGSRISRIVAHLHAAASGQVGESRALLDEALSAPVPTEPLPFVSEGDQRVGGSPAAVADPGAVTINIHVGAGTLPTIRSGSPGSPPVLVSAPTPLPVVSGIAMPGLELFRGEAQKSVITALNSLQDRRNEPYLPDADETEGRITNYYGDLPARVAANALDEAELYDALEALVSVFDIASAFPESLRSVEAVRRADLESIGLEANVILEDARYDRARAHLYLSVDLQPDRMLSGVYTRAAISPEQLLLKDMFAQLGQADRLPRRFKNNQFLNCEHIVPQSWFNKEPIPKADLHHLITADGQANNYRTDAVYREIAGEPEVETRPNGLPDYMEDPGAKLKNPNRFEPHDSVKPIVARATLYFLLAHKQKISSVKYGPDDIEMLKRWSQLSAPSDYERHRNETISVIQGNRNPLIDFPDWVDKIDFTRGVHLV